MCVSSECTHQWIMPIWFLLQFCYWLILLAFIELEEKRLCEKRRVLIKSGLFSIHILYTKTPNHCRNESIWKRIREREREWVHERRIERPHHKNLENICVLHVIRLIKLQTAITLEPPTRINILFCWSVIKANVNVLISYSGFSCLILVLQKG